MWWKVCFFDYIIFIYYDVELYIDLKKLEFYGDVDIYLKVLKLIKVIFVYVNLMNVIFVLVVEFLNEGE